MLENLAPFVSQLHTNSPIDEQDRSAILRLPIDIQSFANEKKVVSQGDTGNQLIILLKGHAVRQKTNSMGACQISMIHLPGDALNLSALFLNYADCDVITLANAVVAFVPRHEVNDLITARPSIMHALLNFTLVGLSINSETLFSQGRRNAKSRVAHFLCDYVVRMQARGLMNDSIFTLPLTQAQLADATGLTTVHVNRTLNKLAADGLIAQKGRSFSVPNLKALKQAGDFSTRYLYL